MFRQKLHVYRGLKLTYLVGEYTALPPIVPHVDSMPSGMEDELPVLFTQLGDMDNVWHVMCLAEPESEGTTFVELGALPARAVNEL